MTTIPPEFRALPAVKNPFISANGPVYVRWQEQRFTMGFMVEERHCNSANMCHGGMLMTLADMTLLVGCNIQTNIRQFLVTVSLSADMLASAYQGDWIEGSCEVLRQSKNMVVAQGKLSVQGKNIVRMNGLFKPIGEPNSHPGAAAMFGLTENP